MKAASGYLIGAALMAIVGVACLGAGLLDRGLAHAQERALSADYREPQQIYQRANWYYDYASRLPWIGDGPLNDLRAREAALQYWQGQYAAVVPARADPVANIPPDSVDLQFIVANAMYREGLARAKDKEGALSALDAAMHVYMTVLRNAERHDDASFNYEYIVKLRTDVEKGRRKAPQALPPSPGGLRGGPPGETDMEQFKVYVPLETGEIEKQSPARAGKQPPIKKKG